ncbi:transposable element Tcb2 transposase [Trichonephila clavipes]|uniref:Transposable element Tcb2 transposase n=1 Tax=Trichonephila clavipes TaxID=2585209 RepID=A0A8X6V5F3_TRICX|nr:transposable element Tcb2 transposase [Trichonephila clavipes]
MNETTPLGNMSETTQQEKTTQLGSRNKTTQLASRNETTQLVSRNETTQLCTAVDRLQPPTTPTTAYNRLQPPTTPTTACNHLQPPTTACNRLHRLYSRIGFFYLCRRRATTPNEDRYLVLTARRHRNMNATLLQQHLRLATGTRVSTQTVRNRLHGVGLYALQPMVCVRLTSRYHRDRREWATEHVNWRRNEWSSVLFSDESHFSVQPDNRRIFIWRDRGSRNNPALVHESVRFGGGRVLMYGGISIDGRTDLYIIRDGFLTAPRYRDEILRPIVIPYAAAIGDDFILMDDNCRPHRAKMVKDFLFEEGIARMEWPACSPDMNPIEHVWDALGRRVADRQPPLQTLQELERALPEEWDRIPQLVINSLIDSMP